MATRPARGLLAALALAVIAPRRPPRRPRCASPSTAPRSRHGSGGSFAFHSVIANDGATSARGLVAHLNIVSLGRGLYVDPEDWSSQRTRYLADPAARQHHPHVEAHRRQCGSLAVYVAVLPRSGPASPSVTGPAVAVDVAQRHTLDAGGILPLALGIPVLLAAVAVGLRLRRRRSVRAA